MRSLYLLSTLILLGITYPEQQIKAAGIDDKILKNTAVYSVYELSPKTTAIVINYGETNPATIFDKIFDKIEEQDSIKANWLYSQFDESIPIKGVEIIDTTGVYSLLYNKKVESEMMSEMNHEFYIYGTKGFEILKPQKFVFGLDECKTNIFAFIIDKLDSNKSGVPIIASDKKLDVIYGKNYQGIERKINSYYNNIEADYQDNIPTKVYANIGNLYFTYTDDFKWRDTFNFDNTECFFPSRAIFRLEKDGTVTPIWEDSLDLFGIPCD